MPVKTLGSNGVEFPEIHVRRLVFDKIQLHPIKSHSVESKLISQGGPPTWPRKVASQDGLPRLPPTVAFQCVLARWLPKVAT